MAADLRRDLSCVSHGAGIYSLNLSEQWSFRAPSGGVLMAAALRAVTEEVEDSQKRVLSATTTFYRPVPAGPLRVRCELLRRGNVAVQAMAWLYAGDDPDASMVVTATFVGARAAPEAVDVAWPDARPPGEAADAMSDEALNPHRLRFFQNFDVRMVIGEPWWRKAGPSAPHRVARWMRYRVPPRLPSGELDPLALCPVADTMPAGLLAGLGGGRRMFAPSLDLTVHFLEDTQCDWLLAHSYVRWAGRGYATGQMEIWSEDKTLVAYATQTMMLRAPR